jgi:hypothetical protein
MTIKRSKTTKRMIIIAAAIALVIIIPIVVLFVDFDRDGLPNYQELSLGTGILTADSDNDGLSDGSEVDVYQTEPLVADTDNDGLQDGLEVNTYKTNPLTADSDGDSLSDGQEVITYKTNPLSTDTDNDNLGDFAEITTYRTDPLVADTDNDGLSDGSEVNVYRTEPLVADTDNDGLQDGWEVNYNLNPLENDASGDIDNDGLNNLQEYERGTVPNNPDTDSDNLWDGEEVAIWGTDPLSISPQPSITVVPNKTGISAILYFETENIISCKVKYGTDANYGSERSEVRAGTEHLIIFPDLTPNLEYRYTIGASYEGRDIYSRERTFTSINAVNNWDNELQNYTVNLFVYFNFDANQDNFDTWESYLREAARRIYDATDGYIRIGTVVMTDSPEGDFADFDYVADMKIGFFRERDGYNATGGDYYAIGRPNIFIELGIYGDYYREDWTDDPTGYPWAPPVITHEFGHYALGLRDEYYYVDDSVVYFCTNNTYNSSLMSSLGDWSGWEWTGTEWLPISPFNYYSELCMDSTHTQGINWEGTDIEYSMWRTLDRGDPNIPSPGYQNIPDDYYTGDATPIQDVEPGWDGALSFIIVNF